VSAVGFEEGLRRFDLHLRAERNLSVHTRDALARALKLAPEGLAPALLELDLVGAVAEDRDGCWRIVSPPPAGRAYGAARLIAG